MKRYCLFFVCFLTGFISPMPVIPANTNALENRNSKTINLAKNIESPAPSSCLNLDGLPPVGQQFVAGSCYAWAAAYYYLTHLQWQEYGWDVTDPAHQCSPAFVYNLTNGGVDNGAWEGNNARRDAFKVFETMGCATMADMPYDYRIYRDFPGEQAFRNGMKFRTLATHFIHTRSDSGVQELKNHLLKGNLAVLGILGYTNLDNIHLYNNTYCVSQARGGRLYWHEVTVIGFDDNRATADGTGAFRLVNEWGTGWGDRGFFWMSYEAVKSTKTSYGYAMYATDRIGYEPGLVARIQVQHSDRYNLRYKAGFGAIAAPDTVLSFFVFNPMSLATGIAYPHSAFALDLTDMAERLQKDHPNNIFLSVHDQQPNNHHSGMIASIVLEDLSTKLSAATFHTPVPISDSNVDAVVNVTLDYSFSPPRDLSAVLDTQNGQVLLSWTAPIDGSGVIDYRIYQNGMLIDSTIMTRQAVDLPDPGYHRYSVSARYATGQSLQPMTTLVRPVPFGIPFSDGFEASLIDWMQAGISGLKAKIIAEPVYQGSHALGMQSYESDYTALLRAFAPIEGAVIEAWFNMESYPSSNQGFGAAIYLTNQRTELMGAFINKDGNPGCLYPSASQQPNIKILDSTLIVSLNRWYQQKIWYCNGKLHTMLLDKDRNVLLNKVTRIRDVQISQAGLLAWGLNGGWNYFDDFRITEWSNASSAHFMPVESTDQPYALIITQGLLAGDTLQIGDEIAVFDNDLCVGAVTVDGRWPLELNAWQKVDDHPGFQPQSPIIFRLWSQESNTEFYADPSFAVGDGTFSHGIFSRLSLVASQIVGVEEGDSAVPKVFSIAPAYPNPFNAKTIVMLDLPQASEVEVTVYNIMGQKVAILAQDRFNAGRHRFIFDARGLASGVYLIHAAIKGRIIAVSKVLLMR